MQKITIFKCKHIKLIFNSIINTHDTEFSIKEAEISNDRSKVICSYNPLEMVSENTNAPTYSIFSYDIINDLISKAERIRHPGSAIAFSPDDKYFALGEYKAYGDHKWESTGNSYIYQTNNLEKLIDFSSSGGVLDIAFSNNGRYIFEAKRHELKIWAIE